MHLFTFGGSSCLLYREELRIMLLINAFLACCSCCLCILTMLKFTTFLSTQTERNALTAKHEVNILTDDGKVIEERRSVFELAMEVIRTTAIMLLFVLQHSLMASEWWKNILTKCNIVTCQRALYVISTCWMMQFMMSYLEPLHLGPLWYLSTSNSTIIWSLFFVIHVVAWLLLYATCIIMDFTEMVGMRQVYYQYLDCAPPLALKSAATRRLYGHMRHGGASCLLVVLWVHPLMTSTRVIVASILTLYLLCGFSVCEQDYIYLREQIARKRITFRLHRAKTIELLQ